MQIGLEVFEKITINNQVAFDRTYINVISKLEYNNLINVINRTTDNYDLNFELPTGSQLYFTKNSIFPRDRFTQWKNRVLKEKGRIVNIKRNIRNANYIVLPDEELDEIIHCDWAENDFFTPIVIELKYLEEETDILMSNSNSIYNYTLGSKQIIRTVLTENIDYTINNNKVKILKKPNCRYIVLYKFNVTNTDINITDLIHSILGDINNSIYDISYTCDRLINNICTSDRIVDYNSYKRLVNLFSSKDSNKINLAVKILSESNIHKSYWYMLKLWTRFKSSIEKSNIYKSVSLSLFLNCFDDYPESHKFSEAIIFTSSYDFNNFIQYLFERFLTNKVLIQHIDSIILLDIYNTINVNIQNNLQLPSSIKKDDISNYISVFSCVDMTKFIKNILEWRPDLAYIEDIYNVEFMDNFSSYSQFKIKQPDLNE